MDLRKAKSHWESLKREWRDGKLIETPGKGTTEVEAVPLKPEGKK